MDQGTSLRIGASGRSIPVVSAQVDGSKLIRVDVCVGISFGAGAVEPVSRELAVADVAVVALNSGLVGGGISSEPGLETAVFDRKKYVSAQG